MGRSPDPDPVALGRSPDPAPVARWVPTPPRSRWAGSPDPAPVATAGTPPRNQPLDRSDGPKRFNHRRHRTRGKKSREGRSTRTARDDPRPSPPRRQGTTDNGPHQPEALARVSVKTDHGQRTAKGQSLSLRSANMRSDSIEPAGNEERVGNNRPKSRAAVSALRQGLPTSPPGRPEVSKRNLRQETFGQADGGVWRPAEREANRQPGRVTSPKDSAVFYPASAARRKGRAGDRAGCYHARAGCSPAKKICEPATSRL